MYRPTWYAFAFAALACLACISVAFGFASLAMHQSAFWFFGAVFGLAGVALLVRLPSYLRKLHQDNGAILWSADEVGLKIEHGLHVPARCYSWSSVSEIVLAEKLHLIDADETTHIRHVVIVFLCFEDLGPPHWLDRVKSGLAKTAHGRLYYLASYPSDGHHALLDSFKEIAPSTFPTRFEPSLRFVTLTGELSGLSKHK